MRIRFDAQLEQLNKEIIDMGNLIEQAIVMAVEALISQDVEKAKRAMDYDKEVDKQEKEIENICLKLLLQQQPVARDLRIISAALKMITDMERIGDHATDISELTILMASTPYIKKLEHIEKMATESIIMINHSLEAYVSKDLEKAKEVIEHDDMIDNMFSCVRHDLVQMIHQNPDNGEQAADLLMVAKYFERIGDHATNIAEWVIFSITGEHRSMEQ